MKAKDAFNPLVIKTITEVVASIIYDAVYLAAEDTATRLAQLNELADVATKQVMEVFQLWAAA